MKDLTKGNPIRLILIFAIPIFIGNVLQLLYNLIDTRIVGQILGENALAAVGATNSINNLIVGFMLGLINGFSILVARNFGAKEEENLKKSVAATLSLGLLVAVVITVFSVIFLMPLLELLNTPKEVIHESYRFIRIIFLGISISAIYNVCACVLRAMGDAITPLIFLSISVVCNVVLDYVFIGPLNLGVEGAAYATVISQFLSAVLCILYIRKKYPILHLKREDFRFPLPMLRMMFTSGLSMGFMSSLVSIGTVALQSSINTFGTDIIVAHTAARKLTELFMLSFSTLGITMATFASQNLGAKQIKRIKEGLYKTILLTFVWSLGVMVVTYTIAPVLIKWVTASSNEIVIDTATKYLRINTVFYFVPAMITVIRNTMQGIGDCIIPIVSSMIELVGKVLIVLFLAPKLSYMGIIISEPIVWVLMVIPLLLRIFTNPVLKEKEIIVE